MKILSLLLAAGLLALTNAHGCPPMWTKLGRNCYRFFGFPRPQRIAERVCSQFTSCSVDGGTAAAHLASIESAKEQVFAANLLMSIAPENPPPPSWFGLNDIAQEGVWTWSDGKPYLYKNWERGHPNNNQNADCMAMPGERPGAGWISVNCNEEFSYICKMSATDVGQEQQPPQFLNYGDYHHHY